MTVYGAPAASTVDQARHTAQLSHIRCTWPAPSTWPGMAETDVQRTGRSARSTFWVPLSVRYERVQAEVASCFVLSETT